MAKNYITLPTEIGLEAAKQLLTMRYGDPYRIIAIYSLFHLIHVIAQAHAPLV